MGLAHSCKLPQGGGSSGWNRRRCVGRRSAAVFNVATSTRITRRLPNMTGGLGMVNAAVRGRCLCGAVSYDVRRPFAKFVHCYCSRCRKATGSGHASNIYVAPAQFQWLSGQDALARFDLPSAKSFRRSAAPAVRPCRIIRAAAQPSSCRRARWTRRFRNGQRPGSFAGHGLGGRHATPPCPNMPNIQIGGNAPSAAVCRFSGRRDSLRRP